MMDQTSIQSFYGKEVPGVNDGLVCASNQACVAGDAFTKGEVDACLRSSEAQVWHSEQEYKDSDIADLQPGPGRVKVTGRVVNFFKRPFSGAQSPKPNGYYKLTVKDNTGVIIVRPPISFSSSQPIKGLLLTAPGETVVC